MYGQVLWRCHSGRNPFAGWLFTSWHSLAPNGRKDTLMTHPYIDIPLALCLKNNTDLWHVLWDCRSGRKPIFMMTFLIMAFFGRQKSWMTHSYIHIPLNLSPKNNADLWHVWSSTLRLSQWEKTYFHDDFSHHGIFWKGEELNDKLIHPCSSCSMSEE